jgi:NAD-dependent SIR2 family protein deacetylase
MPHAHCPRCGERVTQVATFWSEAAGPLIQHVTCPACAAQLVRPARTWGGPEPWAVAPAESDERAQNKRTDGKAGG